MPALVPRSSIPGAFFCLSRHVISSQQWKDTTIAEASAPGYEMSA
jgi:hypothetical protein